MNKYGVLLYRDIVGNPTGSFTEYTQKQRYAQDIGIYNGSLDKNYGNFATFEQGEFDFEKPIWQGDPEIYIPYTSLALSNSSGVVTGNSFTLTPNEHYSGGGFSIISPMEEYTVQIIVNDYIKKTFHKSKNSYADGFFPFPYNNLTSVKFSFTVIPYHFIKITAIGFGGDRWISDVDFVKEPQIVTHFSLTNEELEYDTLSFSIYNAEKFNFITGEKIIVDETGTFNIGENPKTFYVDTASTNEDGTVDVEAYDDIGRIDELEHTGAVFSGQKLRESATVNYLFANNPYEFGRAFPGEGGDRETKYSGVIAAGTSRREAIRMYLLANMLTLQRRGRLFYIESPMTYEWGFPELEITDADICSPIEVEKLPKVTSVHFSKHRYAVDKSNGKQEAFRDNIARDNTVKRLKYSSPYQPSQTDFYYVKTAGTNEVLEAVDTSGTPPKFDIQRRAGYFSLVQNNYYSQEIVVKSYPYKVNYTEFDVPLTDNTQIKENEVNISNNTLCEDGNDDYFKNYLRKIYSWRTILKFSSIKKMNAGQIIDIDTYDHKEKKMMHYRGIITKKIDRMNGVYDYEVLR